MNEYRQNAINHLKTHLGCVGYRDYLIAELEKIEKIEQIVNAYDGTTPSMIKQFSVIQKVLDKGWENE